MAPSSERSSDIREPRDKRWRQALTGLPVIAFARRATPKPEYAGHRPNPYMAPVRGEVTGLAGDDVYVVLDGETDPVKVAWWNVRPCAPEDR